MERWVNVQPNGGILPTDNLTAFDGALVILDWPEPVVAGLALLDIPVKLWRWTESPRMWADWPGMYVERCPLATFANEPDIEGFPSWYNDACNAWIKEGGKLVAPAYSDESKRGIDPILYHYYSWHCYAGNFTNRQLLLARNYGKPLIGTEYGRAFGQSNVPTDLSNIPEPVAIFIWRWANNPGSGYDVANVNIAFGKESTMQAPSMQWVPSPNFFPGRNGMSVTAIVYHGTAGPNAVNWFQSPASQVSAHYVISRDGSITQCVNLNDSAWHAGVVTPTSPYAGKPNPNYWTVGIEHERDTTNTSPLTDAQVASSKALTAYLRDLYPNAVPILHDAIDVGRICPGPGFPLDAIWIGTNVEPEPTPQPSPTDDADARAYYFQHGYKVDTKHALWTECLLPLYRQWQQMVQDKSPLADACCPGPLVSVEGGTTWGIDTEAAFVKTENSAYGVRKTSTGYLPYRLRVY